MKRFGIAVLFLLASTIVAAAAQRFAVCVTTCTWDGTTTMWSTSSGGATGASAPVAADGAIFDTATCVGGTTCTITVNTNPTIDFLAFSTCTGSTTGCILDFSVNNNNITIVSQYLGNGGGTRTLKMGNGIWSFSAGSGIIWDSSATTNFTFDAGSSTMSMGISFDTGPSFAPGLGLGTYNTFKLNGVVKIITGAGNLNVNNLEIVAPAYIRLDPATVLTVNTSFVTTSSSSTNQIGIVSTTLGAAVSVIVPTSTTISWVGLRDMNFTGSGSTPAAINSFNLGHNTNVTITPPGGGGTSACILGGWLLWRDMPEHINDNFPAWLDKAA